MEKIHRRILWSAIGAGMTLLFIDYSLTGGCLACRYYPLASALYLWWNLQQFWGNGSLLLIDFGLLTLIAAAGFALGKTVPGKLAKSVQLVSFSLLPLGFFILLDDPLEFKTQFSKMSGPITNEMLLLVSGTAFIVSSVAIWRYSL